MISIIIPFYNTEKYIEQCLTSIKGQTFSDFECLMIDDGSTDSSREIASSFLVDKRFKLLNKEHIGFPAAKNLGLANAKGNYICFIDSDDFVNEHYLEDLYNGLLKTRADICCCKLFTFKNKVFEKNELGNIELYKEDKMLKLFRPCTTFMWNKLYKKEIFNNMRFDNVEALSDTMLCYKLFEKANSISYINKTLIYHRVHDENMTYQVRHFSPTYWEHRLNVYLTMCSYLCKHYPQFSNTYKEIFTKELFGLIKANLDENIYNKYLEKEEVKNLIV